jgi:hypothetical protein
VLQGFSVSEKLAPGDQGHRRQGLRRLGARHRHHGPACEAAPAGTPPATAVTAPAPVKKKCKKKKGKKAAAAKKCKKKR